MKKDANIFLKHIAESILLIEHYSKGKTKNDFLADIGLQDQIVRRLEIIGEAVKNLPDIVLISHPEIPWKLIAGLRDVVIHHYFGVDPVLIWGVVEDDIQPLKKAITEILNSRKK